MNFIVDSQRHILVLEEPREHQRNFHPFQFNNDVFRFHIPAATGHQLLKPVQMDFSLLTINELNVELPPLQVNEIRELPDELLAGSGI